MEDFLKKRDLITEKEYISALDFLGKDKLRYFSKQEEELSFKKLVNKQFYKAAIKSLNHISYVDQSFFDIANKITSKVDKIKAIEKMNKMEKISD